MEECHFGLVNALEILHDVGVMQGFTKLKVWEKAHRLTVSIYGITRAFPDDERYGLTSQLRRGAASMPANIAEGCGRHSRADLARFLDNAMGSASELEYHLLLARELEYLTSAQYGDTREGAIEVKRMLAGLIQRLRAESKPGAQRPPTEN